MAGATARRHLRIVWLVVLALFAGACDLARPEGDSVLRFRDDVFTSVTVTQDVPYRSAVDQAGNPTVLKFDLYEPTGDTMPKRPLIIWIHGGGFSGGNEHSPELTDQARFFARKGYVNASITYRLSARGCWGHISCLEAVVDAIEDGRAAVRFFRAHSAEYGIDPDRIAVAGTSAGAITALNIGYGTPVPGNGGNRGLSSAVQAAVSLSGGLMFNSSVDAGDANSLMFHGTADPLVPYSWAESTAKTAGAAGLQGHLITWEGEGHVPYLQHRAQILELTSNFLFHTLDLRGLLSGAQAS